MKKSVLVHFEPGSKRLRRFQTEPVLKNSSTDVDGISGRSDCDVGRNSTYPPIVRGWDLDLCAKSPESGATHLADVDVHHLVSHKAHLLLRLQTFSVRLRQHPAKFCCGRCARHVSSGNCAGLSRSYARLIGGCGR